MSKQTADSNRAEGDASALFLFVTGAGTCTQTPELLGKLIDLGWKVYSVLTPNVETVAPPATLMDVPGNQWVHAYRQPPLERYPFGTLLVAPCTFNTFNKLALGLADNLATAMIADGIGAGCRTLIAPSMNAGLWSHPQTQMSMATLTDWGCEIIQPMMDEGQPTMASIDTILDALSGPGILR